MVSLVPITPHERATLTNLMQLYVYDWSEMLPLEVDAEGRFAHPPLETYLDGKNAEHHGFLLEVEGKLAGFALVVARSRLTGEPGVFDVAEFFILRRYRRRGLGLRAADALFSRFEGRWEIRQRDENVSATAFWRRAVSSFTEGRYQESRWDDARFRGVVQSFSTPPAPTSESQRAGS